MGCCASTERSVTASRASRWRSTGIVAMRDCKLKKYREREDVYEGDIQQQEEGKGLDRGTPKHLVVSDVSTSMEWDEDQKSTV
ncbi:Plant intracellular Ras-group-related LRR protein 7 [Nymphaea thermarum]|nr:Plant intracellular Ras-group-related LRR protein 7 [Nymphaea thermarum]